MVINAEDYFSYTTFDKEQLEQGVTHQLKWIHIRGIHNHPEFRQDEYVTNVELDKQYFEIHLRDTISMNFPDIIDAILTGKPYPIKAVYNVGCNPLLTYNHAQKVHEALRSLDFLAVADMFMTPTAALADIVLPVATCFEFNDVVVPFYSIPPAALETSHAASVYLNRVDVL